ncbi:hypothetical protein PS639_06493 [Pseudomonas fluorescens]|nr:hypothetical protein PS639_06493 [Pseudomonas fluorescens]
MPWPRPSTNDWPRPVSTDCPESNNNKESLHVIEVRRHRYRGHRPGPHPSLQPDLAQQPGRGGDRHQPATSGQGRFRPEADRRGLSRRSLADQGAGSRGNPSHLLGAEPRRVRAGGDCRGQTGVLREAPGRHRRRLPQDRRSRSGPRQTPGAGRFHASVRRGLSRPEISDRQRPDRRAADAALCAPQPDGGRELQDRHGDHRHADP